MGNFKYLWLELRSDPMDRQLGSKPHWRGSSFTVLPSTPIRQPGGTVRVAVAAVFGLAHEPHQKVLPRPRAGPQELRERRARIGRAAPAPSTSAPWPPRRQTTKTHKPKNHPVRRIFGLTRGADFAGLGPASRIRTVGPPLQEGTGSPAALIEIVSRPARQLRKGRWDY